MGTEFEQQGAVLLAQSDGCAVWQFRNETGDGTMTTYKVFPGVVLSFNDFHMERFESSYVADRRLFAIDHCREGRMEYSPGSNMLAYTAAGDMKLDLRLQHTGTFIFPSHHYHGLTIAFDRDLVRESLPLEVKDFPATPESIIARWALGTYPRVVHGAAIGTWLTAYRMNLAAELLIRQQDLSIAETGGRVGYDNAGKFTQAFKRVMKLTPSEYRKERGFSYEA